jgi:hypothetical protein
MGTKVISDVEHEESAKDESEAILEESRMVLPGIQALFGFQLIAVFQDGFQSRLQQGEKLVHFAAIALVLIAIALAMGPAAFHRQAEPHLVTRRFLKLATDMLTAGMGALALALSAELYLVARVLTNDVRVAGIATALALALYGGTWFLLPRTKRRG